MQRNEETERLKNRMDLQPNRDMTGNRKKQHMTAEDRKKKSEPGNNACRITSADM